MIFAQHLTNLDGWGTLRLASRVLAIILLAIATGAMTRYYLSRPKMPVKAFIGFACFAVALMGTEVYKIAAPGLWRWWLTPFVIAGSVSVIWGVWPALQWRHGQVGNDHGDETQWRQDGSTEDE